MTQLFKLKNLRFLLLGLALAFTACPPTDEDFDPQSPAGAPTTPPNYVAPPTAGSY